jgi:hypothetical protein
MLDRAGKKVPGAELKVASFYSIPYDDGKFNYVVETNALSGKVFDKLMTKLGSLNEDVGKDCLRIFAELGYQPEVDVMTKRYHIYGIKKK